MLADPRFAALLAPAEHLGFHIDAYKKIVARELCGDSWRLALPTRAVRAARLQRYAGTDYKERLLNQNFLFRFVRAKLVGDSAIFGQLPP